MAYVIAVELLVKPEHTGAFRALIARHAESSKKEEGCSLFEVAEVVDEPGRFVMHEVYRDERAYAEHRATAHYAHFREHVPAMLITHNGTLFQRRYVARRIGA
jgi:quinol monooxygenase YgiN